MTGIEGVYAQALYSLAREEQLEGQILRELQVLDDCFALTPAYLPLLASPKLPKEERFAIVDSSFRGSVHPYVWNFLKLLIQKGLIRRFHDCHKAYQALYRKDHGILIVTAVTAVPLGKKQAELLRKKLASLTGKQIELELRVDPACLGGIRLDYDGIRLDGTVAHRLASIGKLLRENIR